MITNTDISAAAQTLSTILSYMDYRGVDDYDFVVSAAAADKNPAPGNLWASPTYKIVATSPVVYAALTSALAVAGRQLDTASDTTVLQHAQSAGVPATVSPGTYGDVRQEAADGLAHLLQLGAGTVLVAAAPTGLAKLSTTQKVAWAAVAVGVLGAIGVSIWAVRRAVR